MDFRIGMTRNDEQIMVKTFNEGGVVESKILDVNDIREQNLQAFIFQNNLKSEELINQFSQETKFYPVRSNEDLAIGFEQFENLNLEQGKKLFEKIQEPWILQNNINLLEEIFKARNHLNNLWPNDRTGFFEEFWFTLRSQLGASEMTIIYNDMLKATKEGEKNKLIKVKVVGTRIPNPLSPDEGDEVVYRNYEKEMTHVLEITDYNKEKGHLVLAGTLKKSPVLIMAKIYRLSRIQKAVLTALIDGLNQN